MRTRAFSLFVALIAAVALVSVSAAATARARSAATIDVSTRASVVRYLRSVHVNPSGVVIERGARNYAGPECPGRGWSCASTRHPVVQVSSAGGRNSFTCSTAHCAVVQVAASATATNTAKCVKVGVASTQTCSILQVSSKGNNLAVVYETIQPGPLKAAASAIIRQTATGASNGNTACVTQNITLNRSGKGASFTASLNARQNVSITQDATGSGANSAQFAAKATGTCDVTHPLAQRQTLKSVANATGAVTQTENALNGGANVTIDIEQNQGAGHDVASGTNNATVLQTNSLTAIAKSSKGPVKQTQSSTHGGLLGTINQDSAGVSTANAHQIEVQCEDAAKTALTKCDAADQDASEAPASLTQTQFGPVNKGGVFKGGAVRKGSGTSTQTGNAGDTFTVDQSSTQNNDTGAGQTNLVQADCSTAGNCTVTQTTDVNGQPSTSTQSGQDINTTVNCTGSACSSSPVTVLQLNPVGQDVGSCQDGFASGSGFQGIPEEVPENVDLSQFDGRRIELRFSFATGDATFNDFEGWYVKNVKVTGTQGPAPVTVFSDSVADGDPNFTAKSDFGSAPGWHVTHRRNGTFGGPAWWYGDEATGTFQSPGPIDACNDTSPNQGTITSAPFTLAANSHLSFDTLWQIESVAPSSYDLMDVEVIPVSGGAP